MKSGGFLGRFLGSLLKTGLTLMKNLLNISAKNVLIPLPLTAATSKEDEGIHKKKWIGDPSRNVSFASFERSTTNNINNFK